MRGVLAIQFEEGPEANCGTSFEERAAEWRVWGYRLALKITACPEAALDAVQEALVRCCKAREQLDHADSPRAWFRKVLVRCALDQKPRRVESNLSERFQMQDDASSLAVRMALAQLEPSHRAILALAFGEGLTYEEIGKLLEIPPGTVGSRLHAAKIAFRKAWGEE